VTERTTPLFLGVVRYHDRIATAVLESPTMADVHQVGMIMRTTPVSAFAGRYPEPATLIGYHDTRDHSPIRDAVWSAIAESYQAGTRLLVVPPSDLEAAKRQWLDVFKPLIERVGDARIKLALAAACWAWQMHQSKEHRDG